MGFVIAGDGHQHAAERFKVRPEVAKIADVDRAPFPRFFAFFTVLTFSPPTAVKRASWDRA